MAGPEHLSHPVNKKAKCWVYLRDLQQECGLTDAALEHIALICGPRCAALPCSALPVSPPGCQPSWLHASCCLGPTSSQHFPSAAKEL